MKRLKQNLPSTTPFINSDFHDILQDQHQLAYSAWLDSINDVQSTTSSADIGIILKGCELVYVEPKVNPTSFNVLFDYKLNFTESDLIYIDGQYYSPSTELLGRIIEVKNSPGFYLKGVTFSDRQTEINEGRIREFRDKTTSTFSVDYRFDLVPLSSNGKFPTASVGVHYVGFQWGGTSRRFKRLLKYNRAGKDDVMMHSNPKSWSVTGEDSPYRIFGNVLFRDFDLKGVGRNEMQGFRMFHELGGKFMVGFSASSPTTPVSAGPLEINYGKAGNIGGTNSPTFSLSQIPTHDHGGVLLQSTTEELDHAHNYIARHPRSNFGTSDAYINLNTWKGGKFEPNDYYSSEYAYLRDYSLHITTQTNWPAAETPFNDLNSITRFIAHRGLFAAYSDNPTRYNSSTDLFQNVRQGPISETILNAPRFNWEKKNLGPAVNPNEFKPDNDAATWKEMSIHTHQILNSGNNSPRENRPPYYVVLYYTKI